MNETCSEKLFWPLKLKNSLLNSKMENQTLSLCQRHIKQEPQRPRRLLIVLQTSCWRLEPRHGVQIGKINIFFINCAKSRTANFFYKVQIFLRRLQKFKIIFQFPLTLLKVSKLRNVFLVSSIVLKNERKIQLLWYLKSFLFVFWVN